MRNSIFWTASFLAFHICAAAEAQTVRFSGVMADGSAPFTVTYGPGTGFIGGNGEYSHSNSGSVPVIGRNSLPEVVIGGTRRAIPDFWDTILERQREFSVSTSIPGWRENGSDVQDYGLLQGPTRADIGLGTPYAYHEYNPTYEINLVEIDGFDASGTQPNIVNTYREEGSFLYSLSLDISGPEDFLSEFRTFRSVGGGFVYDFAPNVFEQTLNFQGQRGVILRMEVGDLGSESLPFLPVTTTPEGGFGFVVPVIPSTRFFFDPPVAVGYDYLVGSGSPLITTAMFPTLAGDNDGFDIYTLDGSTLLFGGVPGSGLVDFTTLTGYASGISGFALRGINPALELDPGDATAFVTGLTFATAGTASLTQTPVTIEWPIPGGGNGAVPEPASWAMLIAGFGLTGAFMRRRRCTVAA